MFSVGKNNQPQHTRVFQDLMSDGKETKMDNCFADCRNNFIIQYQLLLALYYIKDTNQWDCLAYISNAFLIYDAFELADEVARDGT